MWGGRGSRVTRRSIAASSQLLLNVWVDGNATEEVRVEFYARLMRRKVDEGSRSLEVSELPPRREHVLALLRVVPDLLALSIRETDMVSSALLKTAQYLQLSGLIHIRLFARTSIHTMIEDLDEHDCCS